MNKFTLLIGLILLSACATPAPIPQEITDKIAQMQTDDLPRNNNLEQTRCPKSRYHSFDKRMNCKIAVRRELAARQMMREQNTAIEESKNETIKN